MKKFTTQIVVFGFVCLATAISPALADRGKDAASQPALTPVPPPAEGRSRRGASEQMSARVYRPTHADPRMVAEAIQMAHGCRCISQGDQIIISARTSDYAEIEKLLEQLDVPSKPRAPREIQIIKLDRVRLDRVADTLQRIAPDIKFATDFNIGALLMDKTTYKSNVELLDSVIHEVSLAEASNRQQDKDYLIRVVWLISDPESKLSLSGVSEDLFDVSEEMSHMGIHGLCVAAQNMAQTKSIGKFTILSTPAAFENCVMNVEGDISQGPGGAPQLNMNVGANGGGPRFIVQKGSPPGPYPGLLASFKTNLTAPLGQKIVLGVATTLGYQSVFVIQLLEKAPGKAAGKAPNQAKPASAKAK